MRRAVNAPTTTLLLDTLRQATGRADLEFAAPPTPAVGGLLRGDAPLPPRRPARRSRAATSSPASCPTRRPASGRPPIQRAVADQGFPTPAVRLTCRRDRPARPVPHRHGRRRRRAADGRPRASAPSPPRSPTWSATCPTSSPASPRTSTHLDAEPLAEQLDALGTPIPTTTAGFIEEQAGYADALGRPDIAAAGERLVATEPALVGPGDHPRRPPPVQPARHPGRPRRSSTGPSPASPTPASRSASPT